ncbi:RNA-directed DNA polymerase, eukaryota, reverse transcriptase zinc-binding domain protein [Tanacetum coccineum]
MLARSPCSNSIWSVLRRIVLATPVYYIWKERNSRLFTGEVVHCKCGIWSFIEDEGNVVYGDYDDAFLLLLPFQNNADSQKDHDEGKKFSYAKIVNNSNLSNKLNLIPTEINDDGIEVVIFDEDIVSEGSKKWELTVCGYFVGYKMSYQEMRYNIFRMWGKFGLKSVIPNDPSVSLDKAEPSKLPLWIKQKNLPLEAWSSKGISVVASRLGTPLIMDQMASSSCVTQITINFHYGGVFEANHVLYDYGLYFLVPGKNLEDGLRSLKNDDGVRNCRQYALRNNVEIDIYMAHSEFSEHITADSDVSESEDDDYDVYYVSFDNDETASLDHLTDGEDEVVEHRKRGVKKVNVRDGNIKETDGIKSNTVMYKPVEKGDPKAGEKQVMTGGSEMLSGGSNTKRKNNSISQSQVRNKNKFEVLREYDGNESQENEKQNEVGDIEEDDVFECSGMAKKLEFGMLGVCVLLTSKMKLQSSSDEKLQQTILCILEDISSHTVSYVSFVYAANGSIERRNLWADLNRHKQITTGKPWIIGGDMNVILNTNEHSVGVSFVSSEMQEFKDYVNMIEVEDLCSSGLFFTWTKNLKKARDGDVTGVLKKLDRVMVNEDFLKKYDQAHVIFNPYLVSDHSQAVIIIPNSMKRKKKAFKFANFVADKESFIPIVKKGWKTKVDGFQMFQLVKKMRSSNIHLRKLSWHNEVAILKEYMTIMEDEEKLLFQKSKVKWLSLGDRNNSFFHKTLKGRYQRNRIKRVQDVNGRSFEGQEVAEQFNKISNAEALSLEEDVSSKEIKDALFDIGDNKAPGPDGYSVVFFKKAWKVIGDDFCKAVKEFFNSGKLLKDLNSIVISLIPKTQSPLKVNDYRPIACCNVVYKCISKVITGRIKKVLGKLVNINQSAFVTGRQIQDNILLTQELLKGMKITHVCFADDHLVLCHGDAKSVKVVRDTIDEFGKCSGLLPNFHKSTIFFGSVKDEVQEEIMQILPLEKGKLPMRYLGVSLITKRLGIKNCKCLVDKVRNMISNWKNKCLTYAGRLQLIASILESIQVYWCTVFLLPKTILKDINSLLMGLLWCNGELSRGKAKIDWKKIYTLWVKWISTVKLNGKNFWEVSADTNDSLGWKNLLEIRNEISKHVWYKLGDGMKTSLWYDNWCEIGPLCSIISNRSIYSARLTRNMVVANMVINGKWNWPSEWMTEYPIIRHIKGPWINTEKGKLMTCDRMAKWGSYDMHVCALCKGHAESHDHLFFNCPFSQAIWKELKMLMQFQGNANVWGDIIDELADKPNNSIIWSIVRRLCLTGVVYAIWKERNNRVFRDEECSWEVTLKMICENVRLRLMSLNVKNSKAVQQVAVKWNVTLNTKLECYTVKGYCIGSDSYVEKGFMNERGVEEKDDNGFSMKENSKAGVKSSSCNLVNQATKTVMEINDEKKSVNMEFPSTNEVCGNFSNTSSTGMGSQTYAK